MLSLSLLSGPRRLAALGLAVLFFVFPRSGTQAAEGGSFDLERLRLDPSALDSLSVGSGRVMSEGQLRIALGLHYERSPLLVFGEDGESLGAMVGDRLTAHLMAAMAVHPRVELGAHLPIVAFQQGDDLSSWQLRNPRAFAFGSPTLSARGVILRRADGYPTDLSAAARLVIPVGSDGAFARDSFCVAPSLSAGRELGPVLLSAEVGTQLRGSVDVYGERLGSQLDVGASVLAHSFFLKPELVLRGHVPLTDAPASMELLAGARYVIGAFELFALGGPGFGTTPGTPLFRVLVGGAFRSLEVAAPPIDRCAAGQSHLPAECPALDDDGDGVNNGADACPLVAEDLDGFEDGDGCVDADNDGDGIADVSDSCPLQKGVAALAGCPDTDADGVADDSDRCPQKPGPVKEEGCPDSDGDGSADHLDECPTLAGAADRKGCPEPDSDGDGLVDSADKCPQEPGIPETRGCAPVDADEDAVADHLDNCPNEKGPASNQGCPEKKKQLVVIARGKLDIKDKVYFASGRSTILRRSHALLDQIASVIAGHPELVRIEIEGHTDDRGAAEANKRLSQQRAESVRRYLIEKGIEASRLVAVGLGEERPAVPNDTAAAREQNRRVEFRTFDGPEPAFAPAPLLVPKSNPEEGR